MNSLFSRLSTWTAAALLVFGTACDMQVGLGAALDLEAPKVTITSNANLDFVSPSFTLRGTATDNVGVTAVEVTYLKNGSSTPIVNQANLGANNTWSCTPSPALQDGEYIITALAKDRIGNSSKESKVSITVTVDSTSPTMTLSEPKLKTEAELNALDPLNFDNLPYFKNQSFVIRGSIAENFRPGLAEVQLWDTNGTMVKNWQITDTTIPAGVTGSVYSFEITCDSSTLQSNGAALNPAAKTYFQVRTIAKDKAGNTENRSLNYICVYPDRDKPWASFTSNNAGDKVGAQSTFSGNAFDDDGIKTVYVAALPASKVLAAGDYANNWAALSSDGSLTANNFTKTTIDKSADNPQIYTWSLAVPKDAGSYKIYVRVIDANGLVSAAYDSLAFTIKDATTPTVIFTGSSGSTLKYKNGATYLTFAGTWDDNSGSVSSITVRWTKTGQTLPATVNIGAKTWSLDTDPFNFELDGSIIGQLQTFEVTATDAEGNQGIVSKNFYIDTDLTAPTITDLSCSTTNSLTQNNFTTNAELSFQVTMSETVFVSGIPTLLLNSGTVGNPAYATYTYGSGTSVLNFSYKIRSVDNASPLDLKYTGGAASLLLNGGTLRDGSGNDANLAFMAQGAAGSFTAGGKNVYVVDSSIPAAPVINVIDTTHFSVTGVDAGAVAEVSQNNGAWTVVTAGSTYVITDIANTLVAARQRDLAGNQSNSSFYQFVNDNSVPTVLNVSTSNANGTYKAGQVITVQVKFSKNVTVTGLPRILLETGTIDRYATYTSTSGPIVSFSYTIQAGDSAAPLDYTSTSALGLNGGTIKDSIAQDANLTLPTPGAANSLGNTKSIVVDTQAPTVLSVNSLSADGYYRAGQIIPVAVTFSEPVTFAGGNPKLTLANGGTGSATTSVTGNGTTTLTFTYTVAAGDNNSDLDYLSAGGGLVANGATITDAAGNNAVLTLPSPGASGSLGFNKNLIVDTTAPTITSITSTTPNGPYRVGGNINITLTMSEPVLTSGLPQVNLDSGGYGAYSSGSGTNTLSFNYAIMATQNSADLDVTSLTATITDLAGNSFSATLPTGNRLKDNAALVVDTTNPGLMTVAGITVNGNGYAKTNQTFTLTGQAPDIDIQEYSLDNGFTWNTYSGAVTLSTDGSYAVRARQRDLAGNYSTPSTAVTFTLDKIAPVAPVISGLVAGSYNTTQTFTLSGEAGATLKFVTDGSTTWITGTGSSLATTGNYIVKAFQTDLAGNDSVVAGPINITINQISPTVTNVSSTTPNGSYNANRVVSLSVTFDKVVYVNGSPLLQLETGTTDRQATFVTGSGTNTLQFNYLVVAGDTSADLEVLNQTALTLNGGTIIDNVGNNAVLTLPTLAGGTSLSGQKAIVIDTTKPNAPSITDTSNVALSSGTYNASKQFKVVGAEAGGTLEFSIDGGQNWTTYPGTAQTISGSGNLTARQTDAAGNVSDQAANIAIIIDAVHPKASSVTSDLANTTYGIGATIPLKVSFTKTVIVTGTPTLALNTGGVASYVSGNGTSVLTFNYTPAGPSQNTNDLDYFSTTALTLNGGTISDTIGNLADASDLVLPALGTAGSLSNNKDIKIDTLAPTISAVSITTANGNYKAGSTISLTITFSEAVYISSGTPSLLLNSGGSATYALGSGSNSYSFTYVVGNGQNSADLDYSTTASLTANLIDVAGNSATLTLPAVGTVAAAKAVVIDTTAPSAPTITGITAGNKKTDQSFTLTGEAGATLEYSLNNGGTWSTYSGAVPLTSEITYYVTARQTDQAGNTSAQASTITLSIDKTSPAAPFISGITGGIFSTAQTFQVFGESGATLEYSLNNGTSWTTYSGTVTLDPGAGNQTAYNILARQTDASGNGPVATSSPIPVTVDKKAPTLTSTTFSAYVGGQTSGSVDVKVDGSFTLNFSEPVTKATGNITIYRKYNTFPVLLSVDQFNQWTSMMTAAEITQLTSCYTLTTNGTTNGSPNTTGVYVLNYSIDPLFQTTAPAVATTSDAAGMLYLFYKYGYDKIVIDVQTTQVTVSGSQVTVKPFVNYPRGIEFYVNVDSGAFQDQVGTSYAGISTTTDLTFTTGPTATPVIRVQKQSGSETVQPATTSVKITSETSGAVLSYTKNSGTSSTSSTPSVTTPSAPLSSSGNYTAALTIGTAANYTQGEVHYIKAIAKSSSLTESAISEEKAYRTIVATNYDAGSGLIWYRGSNNSGGPTTAPGFPLAWEDNQFTKIKLGAVDTAPAPDRWYWATWEVNVQMEYKALWCDKPSDWASLGPSVYSWESGSNKITQPGGYYVTTPSGMEAWAAHSRPATAPWARTITLDGVNTSSEWTASTTELTTTDSKKINVAYDANYLYIGYTGEDTTVTNKAIYVAIDSTPGTSSDGSNVLPSVNYYEGSAVTLPFNATHLYFFRRNGTANECYKDTYSTSWSARTTITDTTVMQAIGASAANMTEIKIKLTDFGSPSTYVISVYAKDLANVAAPGAGWMFGVLGDTTFTQGTGAKTLTKYGLLDTSSFSAPTAQTWLKP